MSDVTLYSLLKALHVISVVSWFAGILYIGRLFVYYVEASKKGDPAKKILQDQFAIMMRRLWYGITTPAMLLTIGFGIWTMLRFEVYKQGWLHLKLLVVFGLIGYHLMLGKIRKRLISGDHTLTSFKLRLINEIGTLFLISIVMMAYLKSFFNGVWAAMVLTFGIAFMIFAIVVFRRLQNKTTKVVEEIDGLKEKADPKLLNDTNEAN